MLFGFCFEFNGPPTRSKFLGRKPFGPRSVTRRRGASRRRCLHYFNGVRGEAVYAGSGGCAKRQQAGRRRRHRLQGCYEIGRIIIPPMEQGDGREVRYDENANNGESGIHWRVLFCLFFAENSYDLKPRLSPTT